MREFSGGTNDRRAFLKAAGALGVASMSGCVGGDNGGDASEEDVNPEEENVV